MVFWGDSEKYKFLAEKWIPKKKKKQKKTKKIEILSSPGELIKGLPGVVATGSLRSHGSKFYKNMFSVKVDR